MSAFMSFLPALLGASGLFLAHSLLKEENPMATKIMNDIRFPRIGDEIALKVQAKITKYATERAELHAKLEALPAGDSAKERSMEDWCRDDPRETIERRLRALANDTSIMELILRAIERDERDDAGPLYSLTLDDLSFLGF